MKRNIDYYLLLSIEMVNMAVLCLMSKQKRRIYNWYVSQICIQQKVYKKEEENPGARVTQKT